jgi:hypothetical protein
MGPAGDSGYDVGHPIALEIDRNRDIHQVEPGWELLRNEDIGSLVETAFGKVSLDTANTVTTENLRQLVTALAPGPNDFQLFTVR